MLAASTGPTHTEESLEELSILDEDHVDELSIISEAEEERRRRDGARAGEDECAASGPEDEEQRQTIDPQQLLQVLESEEPQPAASPVMAPPDFVLDESAISEVERACLPEFFRTSGVKHASKTPARYVLIRQGILELWRQEYLPSGRYMNKLAVRKRLLETIRGDSGCFSRVHAFLEDIAAINSGIAGGTPPRPGAAKKKLLGEEIDEDFALETLSRRDRRRKVRDTDGEWVEEGRQHIRTIQHRSGDARSRPKRHGHAQRYDPFTLVPLMEYLSVQDDEVPFRVSVASEAMTLMRVHALSSATEVIGLLGGTLHPDRRMSIAVAIPCSSSSSTLIECDMDPVSEMQAHEHLTALGLSLLGWYHSHPDFEPSPSLRDIETQTVYQNAFRRDADAREPFVGFIINPPARVECIHISQNVNSASNYRIPYRLPFEVVPSASVDRSALEALLPHDADLDTLLMGLPPIK